MKLLLVEDDADILEFITDGFKSLGFVVDATTNGNQGSYMARVNPYDAIILDFSLPGKNGLEICEEVRHAGCVTPILFLSVVDDQKTKIEALSKGADDYVTKPFFFEELRERIKALLRRPRKMENPLLTNGDITINTENQTVTRSGIPIYLTRKEYSLLEYLMRNAGVSVTRSMILDHVWSSDSDPMSNTVESHILRLRKKINSGSEIEAIKNIPGRGYIMEI